MQRARRAFRFALLLAALMAGPAAAAGPQATISSGVVQGSVSDGVRAFLGVPYAAQPVGALRWRPPQAAPVWTEPRDAIRYGAACPQPEDKLYGLTPPVQDEACLYLNVWAPAAATGAPLPVMVWLHGGANRIGAGSIPFYDGSRLAKRGVVVVTINYRLGYLGFFAHDALDAERSGGNLALMDQIHALQWVRRNIAQFGGDPGRITVFGESAGGADLLYLMASPSAQGLFHQAIVQSGGGWNQPVTAKEMKQRVSKSLAKAGVAATADADVLRMLAPADLIAALASDKALGFGPFRDGVTVTEAPSAAFAAGRAAKIPLVIGSNDWEGSLLKYFGTGLTGRIMTRVPPFTGWYAGRETTAVQREELMFGDIVFGAPARWIAATHSRHAPAFLYKFSYVTSGNRGKVPGAAHAAEISYVFDNVGVTPRSAAASGPEDRAMAAKVADCWAAFARTGSPACELGKWDPYDPSSDQVLLIDPNPRQLAHPDRRALDGAVEWFGPGTLLGP